jgi:predicted transcriptional regulator
MSFKLLKKLLTEESNPHEKLDPEIEQIPELDHDTIVGLLKDSNRILDETFMREKYRLKPLYLREYVDFLVEKGLLRTFMRSGVVERVEITEKGMQYIKASVSETRQVTPGPASL